MHTVIKCLTEPTLDKPVMVCGLPGIGSVAWLAVNHLQKELKAELFAEVYSPAFSPKVWLTDDGIVKLMRGEFYFWKHSEGESDLVLFSANEQPYSPEGQYELADAVLDLAQKYHVRQVITMGGMATDNFTDRPKVYVGGTDAELVKEVEGFGAVKLAGGAITGTNGLIFGLAKPKNIAAICLLAETPGYLSLDANAAKSALEMSSRLLKVQLDYSALEKQAKENSEAVHKAKGLSRNNLPRDRDLSYVS
jgi:uncharacterized protein (TIGR00162 family)